MNDSKVKGGHMHDTGAVMLDPSEAGVNELPDGRIALSKQVVQDIVDRHNARGDAVGQFEPVMNHLRALRDAMASGQTGDKVPSEPAFRADRAGSA